MLRNQSNKMTPSTCQNEMMCLILQDLTSIPLIAYGAKPAQPCSIDSQVPIEGKSHHKAHVGFLMFSRILDGLQHHLGIVQIGNLMKQIGNQIFTSTFTEIHEARRIGMWRGRLIVGAVAQARQPHLVHKKLVKKKVSFFKCITIFIKWSWKRWPELMEPLRNKLGAFQFCLN